MDAAQIHTWDDLYKHFHHDCHRSERIFRESVQDLGEPDRITLCKILGWSYEEESWPGLMASIYFKLEAKELDNSLPPPKEEPIIETISKPRFHPWILIQDEKYAALYPPMDDATYERTKQSVRDYGFINSITISDQGVLFDGYHRLKMWKELKDEGLTIDLPYEIRNFDREEDLLEFLRIKNEYRRHLVTYERAKAAIKLLPAIREKLQAEGHKKKVATKKGKKDPEPKKKRATDIAGEKVGISGKTVQRVEAIEESGQQEIKEAAAQGQIGISTAYKEIRSREHPKRESGGNGKVNSKTAPPDTITEPTGSALLESESSPEEPDSRVGPQSHTSLEVQDLEPAPVSMKPQVNMYVLALEYAKDGYVRLLNKLYGSDNTRKAFMMIHEKEYLKWLDKAIADAECQCGAPH